MTAPESPLWMLHARRFIVTGEKAYLDAAAKACEDAGIREFLGRKELAGSEIVDRGIFRPLVQRLAAESRLVGAAVVVMLGMRTVAMLAGNFRRVKKDVRELAVSECERCRALAQKHDFYECDAFFARCLGCHFQRIRQWPQAQGCLDCAAALYMHLARTEPRIYLRKFADTLMDINSLECEMGLFNQACETHEWADGVYVQLLAEGALPQGHVGLADATQTPPWNTTAPHHPAGGRPPPMAPPTVNHPRDRLCFARP